MAKTITFTTTEFDIWQTKLEVHKGFFGSNGSLPAVSDHSIQRSNNISGSRPAEQIAEGFTFQYFDKQQVPGRVGIKSESNRIAFYK